ncbi:MAG: helix-turn-helix domain-containing protein [Nitrospira sp. CG24A]|nr:MAG: helix-turn-helix domain-containing protein [Nitrospira sp. CG24A]
MDQAEYGDADVAVCFGRRAGAVTTQAKPHKRLYSIPEAAEYLGRSTWSVRRLIWAGELPSVRAGRRVHLDVCDMEAFIENNKVRENAA